MIQFLKNTEVTLYRSVKDNAPSTKTLDEVSSMIKKDEAVLANTEAARALIGTPQYAAAKQKNGGVVFATVCAGGHARNNIISYTGLVGLEADIHEDEELSNMAFELLKEDPHTVMAGHSASGTGLWWIASYNMCEDMDPEKYRVAWMQADAYYRKVIGIDTDQSVKDPTRLRFIAADAGLYTNYEAESFVVDWDAEIPTQVQQVEEPVSSGNFMAEARSLVDHSITYKIGNRDNYVFQTACVLNRMGVALEEAVKGCLTEFSDYEADEHRVESVVRGAYGRYASEHGSEVVEDNFPTFSDKIDLSVMPEIIQKAASTMERTTDRDIVILSSLTTLSSVMNNITMVYDGHVFYPHSYFMLVAEPGVGKSAITHSARLVDSFHQERVQNYYRKHDEWKAGGGKRSGLPEPKPTLLRVPSDITAPMLKELMAENCYLLLHESDGNTMINKKGEYSNYEPFLLKCFDHDDDGRSRLGDYEHGPSHIEIKNPRLAMAIAITPSGARALMPTWGSGLPSRVAYYTLASTTEWKPSHFGSADTKSADEVFEELGSEFKLKFDSLNTGEPRRFLPTEAQWHKVDAFFAQHKKSLMECIDAAIAGSIHRMAIFFWRSCMQITELKAIESGEYHAGDIPCSEEVIDMMLVVTNVLIEHMLKIYHLYPQDRYHLGAAGANMASNRKVYACLPDEFGVADLFKTCAALGIPLSPQTPRTWTNRWKKDGMIVTITKGRYKKMLIHDMVVKCVNDEVDYLDEKNIKYGSINL